MTWMVRHQGSPKAVSGLSAAAVLEGIADGQWEIDDEVRGDTENRWLPLEQHPEFAEAVADYEPPAPVEPVDESRLDMNPLIDVSLVLLIFFILTATYETIRKVLDMPGQTQSQVDPAVRPVTADQVKDFTIRIAARSENGQTKIRIEDQDVRMQELAGKLGQFANSSKKRQILLDAKGVEWGTVVQIIDAAKSCGIEKILMLRQSPKS